VTRRVKTANRRSPNRLGTVELLPSGRYRASYRREGRKFTAPRTFTTHTEADAWLASEFADRARGVWRDPDAGQVTLRAYAADWLANRPDLAPRTQDNYRRNLDRWILPRVGAVIGSRGVELGEMFVSDLTPATVRAGRAAVFSQARTSAARQLARDRERTEHPARVWARSKGMPVADSGRLSPAVMTAWRAAGEPRPAPRPLSTVVPLESAGKTATAQAYRVLRAILSTAVTEAHTQARCSTSATRKRMATATAVHRHAWASTCAGVAPNRTQARTCFGWGSIVTGSTSSPISSRASDWSGPASAAVRCKIRASIARSTPIYVLTD